MSIPPLYQTNAWNKLKKIAGDLSQSFNIAKALTVSDRCVRFQWQAPYIHLDTSKSFMDDTALETLLELASERDVLGKRTALFAGEIVNSSEQRPALHTALRSLDSKKILQTGESAQSAIRDSQEALISMLEFAETMRNHSELRHVVNVGIGGSDLGPRLLSSALWEYHRKDLQIHFVSNMDPSDWLSLAPHIRPDNTLFIIASKTFTTRETLFNWQQIRTWLDKHQGQKFLGGTNVVAVTANSKMANALGIDIVFPLWDWVGGRYSVWSAVGLSVAIAIGATRFKEFLSGASDMDAHFQHAPPQHNLPILLGLQDIWYRNALNCHSRCVVAYHHGLRLFTDWLQQLEMESNGKSVDSESHPLSCSTAPVIWGGVGTNAQHSFFQMLHQGTDMIPLEILVVQRSWHASMAEQHRSLLANAFAQAQSLMLGRSSSAEGGERACPGNRPSNLLLLDTLTPASLGALLALYEHRVFVSATILGINPFDQWGVELGKRAALDIEERFSTGNLQGLDQSTARLIKETRDKLF